MLMVARSGWWTKLQLSTPARTSSIHRKRLALELQKIFDYSKNTKSELTLFSAD